MPENISTSEQIVTKTSEAIIEEAKHIEENCQYSAKGHFVASQFWNNFSLWIGIPTVILAAVTGVLAFASVILLVGILSAVVVVLSSVTTFLNPKERANAHLLAGNNYDSLLTKARIFWTIDCKTEISEQILTNKLKDIVDQRDKLNRECPQIPSWAYNKGKKGIERGEYHYRVDREKNIK